MSTCYVALYTKDGEVSAREYKRAEITHWGFHSDYGVYNGNRIIFPAVKTDWGVPIQFGLFSVPTGGTAHVIRNIKEIDGTIIKGKRYCFPVGCLTIMFEGNWDGKR